MLNNIKIGHKLNYAFLLITLIASVIGFIGIANIQSIESADRKLYEKMTIPLGDLIFITDSFQKIRINMGDMLRTTDVEKNNYYIQKIDYFKQLISDHEKPLEKTLFTDEGRKYYDTYKSSLATFYKLLDQILVLKIAGENEKAYELLDGEAKTTANDVEKEIELLIKAKIDNGKITLDDNQKLTVYSCILMAIIIFLGVLIAITLCILLTRSITKPLSVLTEGIIYVSKGDIQIKKIDKNDIQKINVRGDELGKIGRALTELINYIKEKETLAKMIANGDLNVEPKIASNEDDFGKAFKEMISSLNNILGQVDASVDQVSTGSTQVSSTSQLLSQGATQQAASLEEITSSVTEINSQAKQNSENAAQANIMARQAMEGANIGNEKMKELVAAMSDINKSAGGIQKIAKAIDDIAFQINLLALNANVEAARAGKYGKGFAVVADEVRNLAVRSGDSVKEAAALVEEAIKNITNGTKLAEITAKQIEEIVVIAGKVADIAEEVTSASKEQTIGLDQINLGLGQIDQVTQSNTASAEESASAAEELASQAIHLKEMISRFSIKKQNLLTDNSVFSRSMLEKIEQEIRNENSLKDQQKLKEMTTKIESTKKAQPVDPVNQGIIINLKDNDFGNF